MGRMKYKTAEEKKLAKIERRRLRKLRREGKLAPGQIPADSPLARFQTTITTSSLIPENQESEEDILEAGYKLYHTTVSEPMAQNHMMILTKKRCEYKMRRVVEPGEGQFKMVTFIRNFLYTKGCPVDPTREAIDWVRLKGLSPKVLSVGKTMPAALETVFSKQDSESKSSVTRKSCSRSKPGSRKGRSRRK